MSRQKVLDTAAAQVGISGRPNKFTNWYGSIGGTTSYAWCVVFIGWCFHQAGLSIFPRTASVVCVLDYAKKNGYFKAKGSYTPTPGDVMIQQSGGASHVGIVTGTSSNCFYTIEGNCGNAVKKVTRYYDGKLTGFFVPPYSGGVTDTVIENNDQEMPKDPILYDSFGTGNNSVNDAFHIDRDETYRFFAGGHDITEYISNLSWQTAPAVTLEQCYTHIQSGTHRNATTSASGFMSSSDKSKLDNATSSYTSSRLILRDSSGRAQVQSPSSTYDIANKTYVDSNFVRKNSATTMTAKLTAQSNTSYTAKQVRNIVFWTSGTTPPATSYGDVVIKTF